MQMPTKFSVVGVDDIARNNLGKRELPSWQMFASVIGTDAPKNHVSFKRLKIKRYLIYAHSTNSAAHVGQK